MKTNYLLPNKFKRIGWLFFIPGIVLGVMYLIFQSGIHVLNTMVFAIAKDLGRTTYFSLTENNILDEVSSLLIIVGGLLIAFSKEKFEDEFISKIRMESLVWATIINYTILFFAIIFVYDMPFFWVLVFNMFTMLIFFIIRFNWALNKSKKQIQDEE